MAIVMMGASGGGLLFVLVQTYMIETVGWRTTYLAMGGFAIIFIFLPAFFFMSNSPAQLGLSGHSELSRKPKEPGRDQLAISDRSWTLREALATRTLWMLLLGTMLGAMVVSGYFVHAVPHMENAGFSRALIGSAWATFFIVNMISKLVWGFIIERITGRWGLVFLSLGEGLGLYLLLSAKVPSDLYLYAFVTGFCHAPFLPLMAMVWGDIFGQKSIGKIYGAMQPAIASAASLGPILGGIFFDRLGNYRLFLQVLIGATLLAAIVFLMVPSPRKKERVSPS